MSILFTGLPFGLVLYVLLSQTMQLHVETNVRDPCALDLNMYVKMKVGLLYSM